MNFKSLRRVGRDRVIIIWNALLGHRDANSSHEVAVRGTEDLDRRHDGQGGCLHADESRLPELSGLWHRPCGGAELIGERKIFSSAWRCASPYVCRTVGSRNAANSFWASGCMNMV